MEFEWDPEKAKANEQKHDLTFHEGATVFGDPLAILFPIPITQWMKNAILLLAVEIESIGSHLAYPTSRKDENNQCTFNDASGKEYP